jgi:hypothetical protein
MIIGHARQLAYLKKAAANGMLGHAYLFEGPRHIGKMTAALEFAGSFFPASERGLIIAGSHPDVILCSRERHLAEESLDLENNIGIDDIRELRRLMALSTRAGTRRIAIIDGAEDMPPAAQQALLKILEEPGGGKLFILVSHDATRLLPTILSRAVSLLFSYLSDADMQKCAKEFGASGPEKEEFLLCAWGRPGVLFRLMTDAVFCKDMREKKAMIDSLAKAPFFERMRVAAVFAGDREAEDEFFFGFFRMFREHLLSAFESGGGANECASLRNALRIKRYLDTTNVNRRLALENVVLDI